MVEEEVDVDVSCFSFLSLVFECIEYVVCWDFAHSDLNFCCYSVQT